jgi:hypothetical protein
MGKIARTHGKPEPRIKGVSLSNETVQGADVARVAGVSLDVLERLFSMPRSYSWLFHGTGARRLQSLQEKGLEVSSHNGFVFASPRPAVAAIFAAARADREDDYGLICRFPAQAPGGEWRKDPLFPSSVRSRTPVPSASLKFKVLDPRKEVEAYRLLLAVAKIMRLRVLAGPRAEAWTKKIAA